MASWSPKIRSKVLSIGVVRAASRHIPKRRPIAVYELSGTFRLVGDITSGVPTDNWFKSNFDDRFQWIAVPYKADFYPMKDSVAQGVTNLIKQINARNGPFVLVGYSQGAGIVANVYEAIRYGSLTPRRADFLGGVVFGNPRRQAGHTFPRCPNPGGHGIAGDIAGADYLLSDCEELWWDFAAPGDQAACTPDSQAGQWESAIYQTLLSNYTGDIHEMLALVGNGIPNAMLAVELAHGIKNLFHGFVTSGAHAQYQNPAYHPLPGDLRSCIEIARDHINSLGPRR
jgi:Cutinase